MIVNLSDIDTAREWLDLHQGHTVIGQTIREALTMLESSVAAREVRRARVILQAPANRRQARRR
jgi:hypothetical protein